MNDGAEKPTYDQFKAAASFADFSVLSNLMAKTLGTLDEPIPEYPKWVCGGGEKVNHALFPKVFESIEELPASKAYALGVAFGMMTSGEKKIAAFNQLVAGPIPKATDEQLAAGRKYFFGEEAKKLTFASDDDVIPVEYRDQMREAESQMDLKEQAEFHQGFADATKMIMGDNESTETTAILLIMVICWRVVESLPTAQSLFDLLAKALPQNVVGEDPKRIQQICRRVGKRFRAPGRPKKTTST